MRPAPRALLLAAFLLASSGCTARLPPPSDVAVALTRLGGFEQPVGVIDDGAGRLFVVEQTGRVMLYSEGGPPATFLDIRDRVGSGGERGLLGLAFPPNSTSWFLVHYTDRSGDTVVSRFHAQGSRADADHEDVLLRQDQPYPNHNGGQIAFGPDGHVYLGLGDGGGQGDPNDNAQDLSTFLGKILRLHVEETGDFTVPDGNPYTGAEEKREVWAYGVRNPWRFSFDMANGDLWIGDVGQNAWEEVDRLPAGTAGANLGWNRFEGSHRFRSGPIGDHVLPVYEYATGPGGTCAVTGGFVYRGASVRALAGSYVFGDYCDGRIRLLTPEGAGYRVTLLVATGFHISSFGQDRQGEVYVVDHEGAVYRLGPAA